MKRKIVALAKNFYNEIVINIVADIFSFSYRLLRCKLYMMAIFHFTSVCTCTIRVGRRASLYEYKHTQAHTLLGA